MSKDEVKLWVDYHTAAFPMFKRQFGPPPKDGKPDNVRKFAFERMVRMLSPFTLEEAKQATDIIAEWEKPSTADRHLYDVVRIIRNRNGVKEQEYDEEGRPKYQCQLCHDTGKALFYVGSVPSWRAHFLKQYQSEWVLWIKHATDCFCAAAGEKPQYGLKSLHEHFVSGWIHKCEMTEHQRQIIEHGHEEPGKIGWQTTPEDF